MRRKGLKVFAITMLCALVMAGCSNVETGSQETAVYEEPVLVENDTETTTEEVLRDGEYTYDSLMEKLSAYPHDDTCFSTRYIFSIENSTADGCAVVIYEPMDGIYRKVSESDVDVTGIQTIKAVALSDAEFTVFYRTDEGIFVLDTVDKGESYTQSELGFEEGKWLTLNDAEFINNKYILGLGGEDWAYMRTPNVYIKDRNALEWSRVEFNVGDLDYLQSSVEIRFYEFTGAVAEFTYTNDLWKKTSLTFPLELSSNPEKYSVEWETMENISEDPEKPILSSADGSVIIELGEYGATLTWNGVECEEYFSSRFIADRISLSEPVDYDNDGELEREFSGLTGVRANPVSYIMDMVDGEIKLISEPARVFKSSVDEGEDFVLKVEIDGCVTPLILDYRSIESYRAEEIWNEDGTVKKSVGGLSVFEWGGTSTYILENKIIFKSVVYLSMFGGADSFLTIYPYYEIKDGKYELLYIEY